MRWSVIRSEWDRDHWEETEVLSGEGDFYDIERELATEGWWLSGEDPEQDGNGDWHIPVSSDEGDDLTLVTDERL